MIARRELVKFISNQFNTDKAYEEASPYKYGVKWHYGRIEIRELLDKIYDEPPVDEKEEFLY